MKKISFLPYPGCTGKYRPMTYRKKKLILEGAPSPSEAGLAFTILFNLM